MWAKPAGHDALNMRTGRLTSYLGMTYSGHEDSGNNPPYAY
jgi:hypothetical protein